MTQPVRARLLVVLALCGCGLDVIGAATSVDGVDGGRVDASQDGSSLADAGAPLDAGPPIARCANLPATWGLVALLPASDACPAGYTAGQIDLRAEPTPRADACTCGCNLDTMPTCTRAAGAKYDNDNSNACALTSGSAWANVTSGACGTDMWPGPYTTSHDWQFGAPTRAGGSCKTAPDKHLDRIDFGRAQKACVPNAGCEGAPPITAPARRCVLSDGDVACPSSVFAERSVTAKSYDLTCAGACTCTVTGTCSGGTATFYAGANCTGASFVIPADGTCQSSPGTGSVASYRYAAVLNGAGCTANGTASATNTTPIGPMTVCCE